MRSRDNEGAFRRRCELKLGESPFDTARKLTWPKPHAFVLRAQNRASAASAEAMITCPKCGEQFTLGDSAPAEPAAPPPPAEPAAPPVEPAALPASSLEDDLLEEIPASEDLPETVGASNDIMELDEFEAALEEINIDSPPLDTGADLDSVAGIQEVESDATDIEVEVPLEIESQPAKAAPAAASGGANEPGMYRVILSKMRSDKMRNDAAEVIAAIQGISTEDALKVAGKLIVTAAKDVTEAKANEIKSTFTEKGIKAIVSKRK